MAAAFIYIVDENDELVDQIEYDPAVEYSAAVHDVSNALGLSLSAARKQVAEGENPDAALTSREKAQQLAEDIVGGAVTGHPYQDRESLRMTETRPAGPPAAQVTKGDQ